MHEHTTLIASLSPHSDLLPSHTEESVHPLLPPVLEAEAGCHPLNHPGGSATDPKSRPQHIPCKSSQPFCLPHLLQFYLVSWKPLV